MRWVEKDELSTQSHSKETTVMQSAVRRNSNGMKLLSVTLPSVTLASALHQPLTCLHSLQFPRV